jgi:K+-transporting ATPase ATPase B chain
MDAKTLSKKRSSYDRALVLEALLNSFRKLDPRVQVRNPVMFVVWIGALLTLVLFFESLAGMDQGAPGFTLAISLLLWFTVVFANFAEALAEGRGGAQSDTPRQSRR